MFHSLVLAQDYSEIQRPRYILKTSLTELLSCEWVVGEVDIYSIFGENETFFRDLPYDLQVVTGTPKDMARRQENPGSDLCATLQVWI